MSFYTDMAAQASQLLAQYGQSITVKQFAAATYNPATGANTNGSETDTVLKGALFDFPSGLEHFGGTLIEKGDKKLLLEAKGGLVPTLKDRIVVGGRTYTVIGLRSSNPAGTPVAYTLHLRQ